MQVLQQGGTESPTKPKGRPRKHSIPEHPEYTSTPSSLQHHGTNLQHHGTQISPEPQSGNDHNRDDIAKRLNYTDEPYVTPYRNHYMDNVIDTSTEDCDLDSDDSGDDIDIEHLVTADV